MNKRNRARAMSTKAARKSERERKLAATKKKQQNRKVVKFYMHISLCMFCLLICSFGWVLLLTQYFVLLLTHTPIVLSSVRPLFYHSIALFQLQIWFASLHISTWYLEIVILHYGHTHARAHIHLYAWHWHDSRHILLHLQHVHVRQVRPFSVFSLSYCFVLSLCLSIPVQKVKTIKI